MKKWIIYSTIFCVFVINACRKEDNPKLPDLTRVPVPVLKIDATVSDEKFDLLRPDTFYAKFTVDLVFKDDIKPQKVDVVVMKNDDSSNVKIFKANVTTYPTTYEVTGQQLLTLFNSPILAGDKFYFSVNITTDKGQEFLAFPGHGAAGWGSNIANENNGNLPVIEFSAPCVFDIGVFGTVGASADYAVVRDDWNDYVKDQVISVAVIDSTTLSFTYNADDALPIIVKVDTLTNNVKVDKQVYGHYGADIFSAESIPGKTSQVDPCTGTLSVNLDHTTDGYEFKGVIILKKK